MSAAELQAVLTDGWRKGDRVLIRAGLHRGKRGQIETFGDEEAVVIVRGQSVAVPLSIIHNASAAQRAVWAAKPDRAVGRKATGRDPTRRMYSMLLPPDLIETVDRLVHARLPRQRRRTVAPTRERFIEDAIREKLDREGGPDDGP